MRRTECEMCDTHIVTVEQQLDAAMRYEARQANRSLGARMESSRISGILAAPVALIGIYVLAYSGSIHLFAYWVITTLYSMCIIWDAHYVRRNASGWQPATMVWLWLSVLNVLAAGLLTFVLTPMYLYKRRAARFGRDDGS